MVLQKQSSGKSGKDKNVTGWYKATYESIEAPIHINFMWETLTSVMEVKDLGMFLDSHLTYDKHIQVLSSSCISKLR